MNTEILTTLVDLPLHQLYMVERDIQELIQKKEKLQAAVEEYYKEGWD